MSYKEYRTAAADIAWLAACAVNGRVPDADRIGRMDLKLLYEVSSRHMLTGITGMALESAGIRNDAFAQARGKAIRNAVIFDMERTRVLQALEQEGIWYMPMKGAVMQTLYPGMGMRQMADNDILVDADRLQDVGRLMERLGFTFGHHGAVHDSWLKEPVLNFEMHQALFYETPYRQLYDYYRNVKDRLIKDQETGFGYHFTDEDFYVYMTAHEYKHYASRGTGLRSLMDTWIYCRKKGPGLDWEYIKRELGKMGVEDFEWQSRSLALHLFGGEEMTGDDADMLDYILSSGTFGTREHLVQNTVRGYGGGIQGKIKYLLGRLFPPMSKVSVNYPFFYRHRIFLPLLPIYNLGRVLLTRRKLLKAELKALLKWED